MQLAEYTDRKITTTIHEDEGDVRACVWWTSEGMLSDERDGENTYSSQLAH